MAHNQLRALVLQLAIHQKITNTLSGIMTTPCKKMNLYFTFECRNCVDLFSKAIGLKACLD